MRKVVLLALILTSCSSSGFMQGSAASKKGKSNAEKHHSAADAQAKEENSFQTDLLSSLEFVKENYGDAEFTVSGYSFANMKTLLEDLVMAELDELDNVEDQPDLNGQSWFFEKMSEYSISYRSAGLTAKGPRLKYSLQSFNNLSAEDKKALVLGQNLRRSGTQPQAAIGTAAQGAIYKAVRGRRLDEVIDDFPFDDGSGSVGPDGTVLITDSPFAG